MTTLQQLDEEWEKDAVIDSTQLDQEVLRGARLHQKWLRYFNEFRIKHHEHNKTVVQMEGVRRRYFNGELTRAELEEHGWEPYNLAEAKTIAAKDKQIETDPVMINLRDKLFRAKLCADTCEEVIKKIRDRGFDIKTATDWQRFVAGN